MRSTELKFILATATVAILTLVAGCKKAPPITLSCNAAPPAIFQGEKVTVTATAGSVSTKKNNNVIYSWSGDGVTGQGESATVDTSSLAPGSYTVKGTVKEGKKGKEGLKPGQTAECTAGYTVKEFEPPTISCSSSPATIKPGESSTITASAVSPQNRPLTYSYSASSGSIEGSGASATFSSAGAPTGAVNISCKVADDKNHTASADTSVTIVAPPPPPVPHTRTLCSMSFDQDARRPTRVDNQAKACLDEVALDLQKESDAKLVIVGSSSAAEKEKTARQEKYAARHKRAKVMEFAAQRAVNAKDYLVTEKGIDASRISIATSSMDGQSAANYLVPAGADFSADVQGTSPVEESTMKPETRKPLPMRHR
ncbi:MAG: hypothetical protein KGN79_00790 [Acidobacteriota bacterium]|nr:hypothetical protein [Acidobacteriota bacterium]